MNQSKTRQHDRFIETARELGCDESEEAFERAFRQIVPPKRPKPKSDQGERPDTKKPGQ